MRDHLIQEFPTPKQTLPLVTIPTIPNCKHLCPTLQPECWLHRQTSIIVVLSQASVVSLLHQTIIIHSAPVPVERATNN